MPKTINDPALIKHVTNVHNDDIHGIFPVGGGFVSGSKDGTVKFFPYTTLMNKPNWNKKPIFSPRVEEKKARDNRHWITALDVFDGDTSVLFGRRNGHFACMDIYSKKIYSNTKMIMTEDVSEQENKYCKQRNEHRITSIKSFHLEGKFTALIGVPHKFYHYDCDSNKVLGHYTFSRPDWPYGFCQISSSRVVAIHGCSLSSFSFNIDANESKWVLEDMMIRDYHYPAKKQKPFISSVMPMEITNKFPNKLALSFFDGKTIILDIETKQTIHESSEHIGRVWQAVPRSQNEYISCADDATVKIWDIRSGVESIHTHYEHPGRVSSIAVLDDPLFVAGTCPNIPARDPQKGQFYFYDMRRNACAAKPKKNSITPKNDEVNSLSTRFSGLGFIRKK